VATFGHVAAALRKALSERSWKIGDLNAAVGKPRAYAGVYQYVSAKSAPGPAMRKKLSKVLAIPETALLRRHPNAASVAEVVPLRIEGPTPARIASGSPVLSFTVNEDGNARIRLDASMPYDKAVPLLRLLLDAGMIVAAA
jgi:hypothetical protein